MKKINKVLSAVLATAVTAAPFLQAPAAYAITNVSIDADKNEAGKKSEYTIEFKIEKELKRGDIVYIEFERYFKIDDSIKTKDVKVNGKKPDRIVVDENLVEIEVDQAFKAGQLIEVVISKGITNPDSDGEYEIWVWTDRDKNDEYGTIEIDDDDDDNSSSKKLKKNAFTVNLDNKAAGAVTSYELDEFDLNSKSDDLEEGEEIVITFPSADMLPDEDDVDPDDVEINGYEVESIEIDGKEVTLEIPEGADGDDSLEIEFSSAFGITNPKKNNNYTITVEYDGYKYQSKPFETTDGNANPTPTTPFTVKPGTSIAGARSSYTIEADFGNKKIDKNQQLKIEFPNAAMLPGYFNTSKIKVNGKSVRKAFANGKFVYLTVSSSLSSSSKVKVTFDYEAGLKNPTNAGQYQVNMTLNGKTLTSQKFTIKAKGTAATPAKATGVQR